MNIFVLDDDIEICAKSMFDSHVSKMVLETAQLLSCAVRYFDITVPEGIYRETHKNHPCSIWARKSKANFNWLRKLGIAISGEYTYRYGKVHASQRIIELMPVFDTDEDITFQPKAVADEFKSVSGVVNAYRLYYISKLSTLSASKTMFTKRAPPGWLYPYYEYSSDKDKFIVKSAPFV